MLPILLQTAQAIASGTCSFGGLNQNDWLGISALIIMASVLISAAIYAFSGFAGGQRAQRIRSYVRFEFVQAALSAGIVLGLFALSAVTCSISSNLTAPSQNPFSFAQHYVGNLLFVQGMSLESNLYSTSIQFGLWSGVLTNGLQSVYSLFPQLSKQIGFGGFAISVDPPSDFGALFENYEAVITGVYIPLIIGCFAMLFIQFITLPLVSASALTIVVPVALIMRSLSFTGPKLRESANGFLALAIAFYFVYPMTFVMDQGIINWMYYCDPSGNCLNPYPQYIAPYSFNNPVPSALFGGQSPPSAGWTLPLTFYQTSFQQLFNNLFNLNLANPLTLIFYAPGMVTALGQQVAQYALEGIILIALDMAITVGFAVGLWKAFTGGLSFLGGEPIL